MTLMTGLLALWHPGIWLIAILTAVSFSLLVVRWIGRAPYGIGKPVRATVLVVIWGGAWFVASHIQNAATPIREPPRLSAKCSLLQDLSPCATKCRVENSSQNQAAQNSSLGFQRFLPYQTQLTADSDTHITIRKQEELPIPRGQGVNKTVMAFSVEIPLIPPKSAVEFILSSVSPDNQRACEYLKTAIRSEQQRKIDSLIPQAAQQSKSFDRQKIIAARAKMDSLFTPGFLMSPEERRKTDFLTTDEEETSKDFGSWVEARGDQDRQLFMETQCVMPVLAAEHSDGTPRYFLFGSGLMAWPIPWRQTSFGYEANMRPPDQYFCASRQIAATQSVLPF